MKNKDVRFIRVRGRIIPIRKKKKGSKTIAAGIAASLSGGGLSSYLSSKGADIALKSKLEVSLINSISMSGIKGSSREAAKMLRNNFKRVQKAKKFALAGSVVKSSSILIGGAIISSGLKKRYGSDDSTREEVLFSIAGHGSSYATLYGASKVGKKLKLAKKIKILKNIGNITTKVF